MTRMTRLLIALTIAACVSVTACTPAQIAAVRTAELSEACQPVTEPESLVGYSFDRESYNAPLGTWTRPDGSTLGYALEEDSTITIGRCLFPKVSQ